MRVKTPLLIALVILSVLVWSSAAAAATIEGTVTYEGKVPNLRQLDLSADPDCAKKHESAPVSEALVLGEGNTMGNIFVHIKSGLPQKDYPVPSEAVKIHQHGCIYEPHVVGVRAGQTVTFVNDDGILHNVHALPEKNREFNLGMPATLKEADKTFSKPEMWFPVKCDVHPWMGAFVAVMEHPYFDVTETDGKYKIENLPAGTYEIEVWHEKLKTKTEKVTVADGETKTVNFTFTR